MIDCETRSREVVAKKSVNDAESTAQAIPKLENRFCRGTFIFLFAIRSNKIPKICFGKSSTRCEVTFASAINLERSKGSGVFGRTD